MLIHGDNLLALKALETDSNVRGKVKFIYIDPPFNTGSAFEHYDDNLEHSTWLNMMRERLVILHDLLAPEGAIALQLDDTEVAYCKVLMDEIFGRKNYITTITIEAATTSSFKTVNIGPTQVTNFILCYSKDKARLIYNQPYLGSKEVDLAHFSRFIENFEDECERWRFKSINSYILSEMGYEGSSANSQWAKAKRALGDDAIEIVNEKANEFAINNAYRVFETKTLQKPAAWLSDHLKRSKDLDHVIKLDRDGLDPLYIYQGRQVYFLGKGLREIDGEKVIARPVSNLWTDLPTNNLQSEGGVSFPSGKKPEALIRRLIQMFTSGSEDIVLDSFGGSGTTGAVAHKMGRRWIMAELGEHAVTHIAPRMKNIILGADKSGVTEVESWKGGGGYRFFKLAPSLLQKDKWGNLVINKDYRPEMLAEAMCKHFNYTYAPSAEHYWMHGKATENAFIYVTTNSLTFDQLKALSDEVGEERSLLICCMAYEGAGDSLTNLTIKKIPRVVLDRCEWGKDDYSLKIAELPMHDEESEAVEITSARPNKNKASAAQANLFDGTEGN
ncbi:site-specific DNA-methyltransferase [Metapseudomonas lalkuanensis]|uniref:site-specific DNA-methyltransferase (adenine-specific) n=2 Tax=Metapseudomonas lalkuanensis TaxID=2604832 RepID=A0A5J6QTN6_9GAMM|nr:site-specific DNA-methyltransferase [Pseudomonas lalkuanensis]